MEAGVAAEIEHARFAEDMDVGGGVEESLALPDGIRAGEGIVVSREDVDGQGRVRPEEIDHGPNERVFHLVVLEKIAGDEKGVGRFLAGDP